MPATTQKSASRSSESSQSVADAPRWQRMAPWLAAALVALVTLLVFGRVIGFDYNALPIVMRALGIARRDQPGVFRQLQIAEDELLK